MLQPCWISSSGWSWANSWLLGTVQDKLDSTSVGDQMQLPLSKDNNNEQGILDGATCAGIDLPRWDKKLRQLWFGDKLIMQYTRPANNQETVLSTFEDDRLTGK